MPNNWEIQLDTGHIWYVGSWAVPHSNTDAQVVIPIEQLDGLTDEQIGAAVRACIDHARLCNADERAYNILAWAESLTGYSEDRLREDYEAMRPFVNASERIAQAIAVLDGRAPHPKSTTPPTPLPRRNQPGYIYLLLAETGHYKIGRTKDLPARMKSFGLQLPFKVELVHTIEAKNMHATEQMLHERFADRRVNGEWFDLAPNDVAWITSHSAL